MDVRNMWRNRTSLTTINKCATGTLVPWTDIDVLKRSFLFHMRSPRLSMLLCGGDLRPHKYIGHGQVSTLKNEFWLFGTTEPQ